MPLKKERRIGGTVLSLLVHVLIVLFIVIDVSHPEIIADAIGLAGPGLAGGGGGGNRGTGGIQERVEFVKVRPPPPPPRPAEVPPLVPPPPPPEKEEEKVTPVPPPAETEAKATSDEVTSIVAGSGGGSGNDGSAGTGPGTGGGRGTGVGTGTGSDVGPGTGGGTGRASMPVPTEVVLVLPIPAKLRGSATVVQFEIDSTGKVLDFDFEPTKDSKYNQLLRARLGEIRFRPAVNAEGIPIRVKYAMKVSF